MIHLRKRLQTALVSGLAAACCAAMVPTQALADDQAQEAQADPYSDLLDAMQAGVDEALMMDNLAGSVAHQLITDVPIYADIQAAEPTFEMKLATAVRPTLMDYSHRVHREYDPKLLDVMRGDLTPDEAANIAHFYRSELGIALLQSVSRNLASESVLAEGIKGEGVSVESVESDARRSGIRALLGLTPEQRLALNKVALEHPELAKMNTVTASMAPVRAEMENVPLTAEEQAQLSGAIQALVGGLLDGSSQDPQPGSESE